MASEGGRRTIGGRRSRFRFAFPAALLLLALGGCRASNDDGGPAGVARPTASPDPPPVAGGLLFNLVPEREALPAGEPPALIAEWRNAAATRVWLPAPVRLAALVVAGTRLIAADGSAVYRPTLAGASAPGAAGNDATPTLLAPGELVTLRLTVHRLARTDLPGDAPESALPPGEYHLTAEFSTLGAGPEAWGAENWDRLWKGRAVCLPVAFTVLPPPAPPTEPPAPAAVQP